MSHGIASSPENGQSTQCCCSQPCIRKGMDWLRFQHSLPVALLERVNCYYMETNYRSTLASEFLVINVRYKIRLDFSFSLEKMKVHGKTSWIIQNFNTVAVYMHALQPVYNPRALLVFQATIDTGLLNRRSKCFLLSFSTHTACCLGDTTASHPFTFPTADCAIVFSSLFTVNFSRSLSTCPGIYLSDDFSCAPRFQDSRHTDHSNCFYYRSFTTSAQVPSNCMSPLFPADRQLHTKTP